MAENRLLPSYGGALRLGFAPTVPSFEVHGAPPLLAGRLLEAVGTRLPPRQAVSAVQAWGTAARAEQSVVEKPAEPVLVEALAVPARALAFPRPRSKPSGLTLLDKSRDFALGGLGIFLPLDLTSELCTGAAEAGAQATPQKPPPVPLPMAELQYLVTYDMLHNFYFNLVLWFPLTNTIAIAIGSRSYWWDGLAQVRDMRTHDPSRAPITCISCSAGLLVAVAYANGVVLLWATPQRTLVASRHFLAAVFCMRWFPGLAHLVAGDLGGTVHLLNTALEPVAVIRAFSQQSCGTSTPLPVISNIRNRH